MIKNRLLHFPPKKEYEYAVYCLSKLMLLLVDIQCYFENPERYDAKAPEWFVTQIREGFHSLPGAAVEIVRKLQEFETLKDTAQKPKEN